MASIISAGTTSGTALNMTADTSGQLQLATGASATTAVTIDTSQNVGIGTTSPTRPLSVSTSNYQVASFISSNVETNFQIKNTGTNGRDWSIVAGGNGGAFSSGQLGIYDSTASAARMCIDSSGNVLVGTTSPLAGGSTFVTANNARFAIQNTNASPLGLYVNYSTGPNGTGNEYIYCSDTSIRMTVRSNGGIANFSANNVNLSDEREKKNIELAGSYLDKICAIPVKTFLYNDQTDTDLNLGVIAQDVQAVAPELVSESNWGTKEEPKERLSIYQTDLQYALMKCIQEQQTIINDLKARIETLEAK